ncbi:ABC transporter substrate-binding protein [Actinocrispum wychmicini]|uniref:NitT/TauT family transport system substrate-binding protein n=1 Tax=Actinocrispum wychmicini TaxID=1213861 RepID=A0A4R2JR79_9PSEU|nr:ABC transporter substrate-binding protein [Actinocrispum wychmicini]TCO62763.1 NitT/TauT family transport system substrate-binding protein [Actinocrispum wychmicini]
MSGRVAAIGAVLLALTTACGTAAPANDGMTITVSNPANVSNVPLHIAMDEGYFAAEGLTVKADVDLGSGSTIEAVVGGQVDMAWANVVNVIDVHGKGLGVRLVAVTDTAVEGAQQVLVPKTSTAKDITDLAGKKVAVLSPTTVCVLGIRAALKAKGLPVNAITAVPVAPPEHANVLAGGEVAGTCTSDPFRTQMIDKLGARPVFDPSFGELANYLVGGYVVADKFAKQHPAALAAFQRALLKATERANARPDIVRTALPKFTTINQDIANRAVINKYVEAKDAALIKTQLQRTADAMLTYGMVAKPVDTSGLLL